MKVPSSSRAQWLAEAPFNLALSGGFFGFFAHTGFLQALEERGLAPQRVVGVSAGALAGGLWASGVGAQALGEVFTSLRREEFWDPGLPLGGLLRGHKFRRKVRGVLAQHGVRDIEQCPVPFAAVVHDLVARRPVALREGPIDRAIVASCTVPLMFRPVLAQGRILVDGAISDRNGLTGLAMGERVLMHALPSRRRFPLWSRGFQAPDLLGRDGLVMVPRGLPRVSPFRLGLGAAALMQAREHAQRWLDARV